MEMQAYFVLASLVAILGYLLYKFISNMNNFWPSRGIQRLNMVNFISRIFGKQQTFQEIDGFLYKQLTSTPYGGYMEMAKPIFFVKDLEIIKQIYVKDFDHFVNRRTFNSQDPHWNHMLFNKSDQDWKDLRSTMSPTFSTGKIRRMFPILKQSSKRLISHLTDVIAKNEGLVDLEDELGKYAMDVISSAAFGIESGIFQDSNSIVARMSQKLQIKFTPLLMIRFLASMISPFVAKIWKFTVIDAEADGFFTKILKDTIQHREKSGEKREDFLQLMIEMKNGQIERERETEEMDTYEKDAQLSQDKQRKKMEVDDDIIIANCILFIFGGFDTTQSALLFAAYALALNQDVQEKLRRELEDAVEHNDGELTYDNVNQIEYLDKVINETLRKYPPSVRTERKCTKDFTLPDSKIVPKDVLVGIPIYQIHYDPAHFPNPNVFDPERFSPEEKAKRHPYAFMPFGHGPRNCIANRFALTEVKTAIANLVLNFDIEPCAKTTIPMKYDKKTSLKPVHGMWLKLNARK